MYKERKETTHVKVGERNIYQHIKKISIKYVNNGHKTHVQEEGGKRSPLQDETHLPFTEACISPPNMYNLKKKPHHNFSPFLSWLTKGTRN